MGGAGVRRARLAAIVVAPDHPWAHRQQPVALDELARTPLIVREPGSGTRETLDRILGRAGVEPARPLMVLDANSAVRAAVIAGLGPAVLSAITVQDELTERRLVEVPLTGATLRRRLHAVWAAGRPLTGSAEQLLEVALTNSPGGAPPALSPRR
ncbi:MAG TPA: LysR substrate-binding domain-containing protein [Pseudonocardia sp.]|nr:LysR substrate-binding domain-containing protein [Pseudonocardia sp.]